MKITWLGQAGLLFECDGKKIVLDPYLSNSCGEKTPRSYRRVPVDKRFLEIEPDVVITTHDHMDHYDTQTLDNYLKSDRSVLCLMPPSCYLRARSEYGTQHNYIYFPSGTSWTEGNIRFTSVKAVHSDPEAIGVIIEAEGKKYYVTGDTLYNENIFKELPEDIDYLFLPVNGVGNNMNFADAKAFIDRVSPKHTVPMHLGMLDDRHITEFEYKNVITPTIYEVIINEGN